jgi:starvation-inducible DNA-binding protein
MSETFRKVNQMDKDAVSEKLKVVLASAFSFAIKVQNYHWNVTGPNFNEYHAFFQTIYERVYNDVDLYAEHVRILGFYSPGSLSRFAELSRIEDELAIPPASKMFARLASDNMILITLLKNLRKDADEINAVGLIVTLEDSINYHEKLQWMLTSFIS